jgi:glycosyltransferase involved in cell wall biosynthesis
MASGKVLITSSVQALAEIVDDGNTGLVFEKDNAKDLAAKLELVLLDADLRRKIGENANKWVLKNHSWDVISERVTDIYDKILEENK